MEKENKFSVLNAFKHDNVVWGIVAAVSVILLLCSGYSLPVSMTYVGVGVACTVFVAHVPHKYFKLCTIPLVAMTIALMVVGIFIAPINGRWLLIDSVAFNPLWFASLSVCFLLTGIAIQKDNIQKMIGVLMLIVICALCFALNMSYAVFLATIAIIGMVLLGIYRKVVVRFVCLMFVVSVLFLGLIFRLGRTVEERRDNSATQMIELPAITQNRIDNMKEYIINGSDSAVEDNHTLNEVEVVNNCNTNILAASYHNIYEYTGIWGCIGITLLYVILLCRVVLRIDSSSSKYAKCLAMCCSIALVLDSASNACMAKCNYPYAATLAMMQYVMFGVILSCLNSCEKATDKRIKTFFNAMIEENNESTSEN